MKRAFAWPFMLLVSCTSEQPVTASDAGTNDVGCAALTCAGACVDPMTDDANCGACGLSCATGCANGRCVVQLASVPNGNAAVVATDGVSLYWSTSSATWTASQPCSSAPCSSLDVVPVDGGTVVQLVAADPSAITDGPVLDDTNVYWIVDTNSPVVGSIYRKPLAGGSVVSVLSAPFVLPPLTVANNQLFYFLSSGVSQAFTLSVMMSPTEGGSSQALYTVGVVDGSAFTAIAADESTIYWGAVGEANPFAFVYELPIAESGGNPLLAAQLMSSIDVLATDAVNVYVGGNGGVQQIAKDGGVSTALAGVGLNDDPLTATNMAVDSVSVYFTDRTHGTVNKVARGGGSVTTLVSGTSFPRFTHGRGIAVDKTSVYWTTGSALMKVTPK